MSWLSKATGIHWNIRPLAAPAGAIVGGLLGGPAGAALGAGLFKSGDNLAHGDNVLHALGQGALNAGLAYGAGSLFGGGGAAASGAPGQVATDVADPLVNQGITPTITSDVGKSVMQRVMGDAGGAASHVGDFIKNNKSTLETIGSGAMGVLNAAQAKRQADIEQSRANAENAQIQQNIDLQKARQAAYASMFGRPLSPGTPGMPQPAPVPPPVAQAAPNAAPYTQPGTQYGTQSPARNQVMSRVLGYQNPYQSPFPYAGAY